MIRHDIRTPVKNRDKCNIANSAGNGRALLIVNPFCGGGRSGLSRRIAHELRYLPYDLDVCETEAPGEARLIAADPPPDTNLIVAAGGDGTISEIVTGLKDRRIPLGIVPLGTANVLARQFNIPLGIRASCDVISGGRISMVDLGESDRGCFLAIAGAGFDAAVVHKYHPTRDGKTSQSDYMRHVFQVIHEYKFPKIQVELDGKIVTEKARSVFIANTRSYGGPFVIAPGAKADDGYFDVCVAFARTSFEYAIFMSASILRCHVDMPRIKIYRARKIRCLSDGDVPAQIDGDPAGFLPLEMTVRPAEIKLLTP